MSSMSSLACCCWLTADIGEVTSAGAHKVSASFLMRKLSTQLCCHVIASWLVEAYCHLQAVLTLMQSVKA